MAANAALHKDAAAASASTAYDPFAEDARPGPSAVGNSLEVLIQIIAKKSSSKPVGNAANGRAPSNGSSRTSSSSRQRKPSPPALGRKEKAIQKLQRASKNSAADSVFSVQALVEAHEGSPRHSPRPTPPRQPVPVSKVPPKAVVKKGGLKRNVDVSGLRKLCPDRDSRDQRTIDEIQRDIRARRATSGTSTPREAEAAPPRKLPREMPREPPGRVRQRRPVSSSDSESDLSDTPPPRKRPRDRSPPFKEPDRATVSALIQGMFNRGRAPRNYTADSDDSDMEAGLDDVLQEEKRAAAIARREDQEAERELAAARAAKDKLRREREKNR